MDNSVYEIMEKLKKEKQVKGDVKYLGTISMTREYENGNGSFQIAKDVLLIIDKTPNGTLIEKYYDENQNFLAARGENGELYPSSYYKYDDLSFLSEIDALKEGPNVISLNDTNKELNKISKILGISKGTIRSMSEVELDTAIDCQNENGKITLSNDEDESLSTDEQEKQNENALKGLDSKQEIDLNVKPDSVHTLAEILGVPTGSKLLVVFSDNIKNNENTTQFTAIIKEPNGKISPCNSLDQTGGKHSDKNVYEMNRDGSHVQEKQIQSSFAIDSELVENGILTVRYGSMGTIEVGYGQIDRKSNRDAVTQKLETRETYPVTREVREEFSPYKGNDNISNKMNEIQYHKENNCNSLSLEEADGNRNTGHLHIDSNEMAKSIIENPNCDRIAKAFTQNEVRNRIEKIHRENPGISNDELLGIAISDLADDAEHMHVPEHQR